MAESRVLQGPSARTCLPTEGLRRLFVPLGVAGMLVASAGIAAGQATERIEPPRLLVSVEDGLLTVDAANVPLADLMRAVGRNAGLETIIYGPLTSPFDTWSLRGVPLVEGILRLAGDNSVAVVYSPMGNQTEKSGRPRLIIYGASTAAPKLTADAPPYLRDLEHADAAVRLGAIETLANAWGDDAVARLRNVVREDADPAVRARAASLIADIGGEHAVNAIAAGLGDEEASVRERVVTLLGGYAEVPATMALGQVYFGERDAEMRRMAVRSLALQRVPAARYIVESATKDEDDAVREEAVQALAQWEK